MSASKLVPPATLAMDSETDFRTVGLGISGATWLSMRSIGYLNLTQPRMRRDKFRETLYVLCRLIGVGAHHQHDAQLYTPYIPSSATHLANDVFFSHSTRCPSVPFVPTHYFISPSPTSFERWIRLSAHLFSWRNERIDSMWSSISLSRKLATANISWSCKNKVIIVICSSQLWSVNIISRKILRSVYCSNLPFQHAHSCTHLPVPR
jgi:hypothetical protein